ncbi:hypothetical protein EV368DRAFT_69290 [Lentinula lateritia]|uniref:Uncharacterized protein n=1 Tax=Lentinula aff. lateritia TaxID=2804960 RepID=A0ACC1TKP6_9AGAR|nr:hypothetical protein F5876DRAFT_69961 [Lentinula aff. lateritia]KAJ3847217.1 hypothetical protein EV368DRAFT_69290 [Lentinula lateritia]
MNKQTVRKNFLVKNFCVPAAGVSGYSLLTFTAAVLLVMSCHLGAIASPLVVREASSAETTASLQLMVRADSYNSSQASTQHNHTVGALERFEAGFILLPQRGRKNVLYYKYGAVLGRHAYLKEGPNPVKYHKLDDREYDQVRPAGIHEAMTLRMVNEETAKKFQASSEHSCEWVVETLDIMKKHTDLLEGIDEKWKGLSDENKMYIRNQISTQEGALKIPFTCQT